MDFHSVCKRLRRGADQLALLPPGKKNDALNRVSLAIEVNRAFILKANERDLAAARNAGIKESLIDRLSLNNKRIDGIINGIKTVIHSPDPVGECDLGYKTLEGLYIKRIRVPLGVAAIIYESRPNVTVEAFSLAYKSGNAILLRGSSSALESNKALVSVMTEALQTLGEKDGGVADALALLDSGDRKDVDFILNAVGEIDVVLPRGGADLIKHVTQNARIPVIETGSGVCHLYVDASADLERAVLIAENAKMQRPGVCNAIETLLVHKDVAEVFLPLLAEKLADKVELRCCSHSFEILRKIPSARIVAASEGDYGFEFLDLILAVKITDSLEEAITHINAHNTKHSDSILTENMENARRFQAEVDAACVYVNASTRFTDGEIFGFGAELGISTQKMHTRGPMGLTALTTTKYLIDGQGQIRER